MTILKRIAKILKWTAVSLCGLMLLLYGIIHLTWVQDKMKSMLVEKLSDMTHMQISVGTLYPIFWEGVALQDVCVVDEKNDTVLNAKGVLVTVERLNLDSSLVELDKVFLHKPDIRVGYDSSGILNISPLLNAFKSSDTTSNFRLLVNEISVRDARFSYKDMTEDQSINNGMNFSNIAVTDMYMQAHLFSMDDAVYRLSIDKLSGKEQSGFQLQYLQTDAMVCDTLIQCGNVSIYTPDTKLSAKNFELGYDSFSDFSDFCDKVNIFVDFNRTNVALSDVAYFASAVDGFPYSFSVEGLVEGTISDFTAEDFHIGYGRSSQFVGSISARGLPDVDKFYFAIDAKKLELNGYDIVHTRIPPYETVTYVELPEFLQGLTYYKYIGSVRGTLANLTAKGHLLTNAGKISTDVGMKHGTTNQCKGNLVFEDFDLSKLKFESFPIGKTTGKIDVDASFNDDSLITANIRGDFDKMEFNDYAYSNFDVDGKLSARKFFGRFSVDDPNLKMKFGGLFDISKDIPEFRFRSAVSSAKLDKLHFLEDSLADVGFSLVVDFQGLDLDDMSGDVSIRDLQYSNAKGSVSTKNIALQVRKDDKKRSVSLRSAFGSVALDGDGRYKDLILSVSSILCRHFPFLPKSAETYSNPSNFNLNVSLQRTDTLFALFQSDIRIAEGTTMTANYYGSDTACKIIASVPRLSYKNNSFYNGDIQLIASNRNVYADAKFALDSQKRSENVLNILGFVKNSSFDFDAKWNATQSIKTSGNVSCFGTMVSKGEGVMPRFEFQLRPTDVAVADSVWKLSESAIILDTSSVAISGFQLYKDKKNISVDGVVSYNPEDYLVIQVQNYDLMDLNSFIQNPNFRLSGMLQGRVRMKNLYDVPLVFANVTSPELSLNNHVVGELRLRSFWENKAKALLLNAVITNDDFESLAVKGKYVPSTDSIHFDVKLADFDLGAFAEILQGTVNDIAGVANADVDVDGTLSNMQYSGDIDVVNGRMTVDYTRVPYTFAGKLKAEDTKFEFRDFMIHDVMKNTGQVRGFLNLKEIKNLQYLFDIETPKLLVMKTQMADNESFYGTVFYKGQATIEGDLSETKISCRGTTLDNTVCSIPVSYSELTGAYDFLFFSSDTSVLPVFEKQTSSSSLTLNMDIDVTSDALAQIIFDPKVGDVIKARGDGNLLVKMDKGGDLNIYGKYQIEEGDYLFTLKNLINKKLILQKGGTIVWNGDPLNAQVDLSANYETKASPQPLFDSTMNMSKRVPVICQVYLKNNLLSPDISYDIVVPQSATQVSEVLATLSEDETTLQFFSLMLQGSFMRLSDDSGSSGSVSFEVLSNQFTNLLSQIDPNMDVSVNYRLGTDNTTSNEFEFGFSRQFWNDRILVNVNGYTDFGDNSSNDSPTDQNQTGDFSGNVSVEMKLNKKGTIKIKGFSRSNDNELSEHQENTNGVGFFFTKDFNTIRDLFRKEQ